MSFVRVRSGPDGPRVYVGARRVHHGAAGMLACLIGMALVAHDWPDRRAWFQHDSLPVR